MKKITTNSPEETELVAANIAKNIESAKTILLKGDLGSGKTTFTKAFAESLGISKKSIKSPTFTIKREYDIPSNPSTTQLNHYDLYRIQEVDEQTENDIIESIESPKTITIIEWAEHLSTPPNSTYTEINFSYIDKNKRQIIIKEQKQ